MSSKETKMRVANAFRAMKGIGISEDKVKPVLKKLLKLYDKNWELIEEENYRALADAIFEREESEAEEHSKKIMENAAVAEHPKKMVNNEEKEDYLEKEAQAHEEPERPLKRLRLKYQDGKSPASDAPHSSSGGKMLLIRPKEEPSELPETSIPKLNASQGTAGTAQPNAENKGKRPISPSGTGRNQQKATEPRSPSHPMRLRDRGKGSVSPKIPSSEKTLVPASAASNAVCLKEPKVGPGNDLSSKQKSNSSYVLITPKDEPVTDDMPRLEVRTAVNCPGLNNGGDSMCSNGTVREHDSLEPSVSPCVNEKERADGAATPNVSMNNNQLALVSGQCFSNLEIASSSFGEVKISLSCDVALGRPDFHMPTLETVLKSVDEKCLRTYKTLDPNFSVMNVMKEFCQCFLKLGSGSNSESPETLNAGQTIGSTDDVGARGLLSGSVASHFDAEATLPKTSPLHPCNGIDDDDSHLKKMDGGDENGTNTENIENFAENPNEMSLVISPQPQVVVLPGLPLYGVVDIAKGREKNVITLVNEMSSETPPSFRYITQNTVFKNACVKFSLARLGDNNCSTCVGDCLSPSTPCACANETAYTTYGLVKEEFLEECISMNHNPNKHCQFFCKECPLERSKGEDITEPCKGHIMRKFIKECWLGCDCTSQCGNRVVQRGITRKLQVFMTPEGKGWGLRTLEDLPKGAFVSEYVGEILTNRELVGRVLRSPKAGKHSYPVLLDAGWGAKEALKDEEALCLDTTYYGNIARFINHRCYDPNLVEIPVELESPDHHYYHLAFFTTRAVRAMEELTWDYGIDFDDHDHPIKPFRCQCGSKFCRNIKRSRGFVCRI
ncbi:hypothetical protein ABFS82_14G207200 [Erythranthe guttata]|uniref:histone-lysine N-methyltransferase SUVR2-like isoform X2 n=1 Tax=Erythranthe guttata TaxID=4155 RepID=UPI00064DAA6B|nr:PREDICTED: histone-lysine N-methyltransferase SUVR2-like isoform X2 [Erythranthe guttata]|eukprot:XP_012828968.1 PREDICTED: histone-lysine N-methyltransferase SUVR2-like isoform X2 [Erythranthe guttata]